MDQQPFIDVPSTLVDVRVLSNPQPRCACVLLLDTSSSMSGEPIRQLNEGVQVFRDDAASDSLTAQRLEVAVVTFGEGVDVRHEFCGIQEFFPATLHASGMTPMGEAVVKGHELLEERKRAYKNSGVEYFQPWMFLISDGEPTDYDRNVWQQACRAVRGSHSTGKLNFFAVGVEGANLSKLSELSPPERPAIKLQGLRFRELFKWLSASLKSVSSSSPGQRVSLPPPSGWADISA